jgi:GntR family transcriptional regulator
MLIQLNTSDDRPIYAQIVDQVKFAIAARVVGPGDLVPSVRELSRRLVVNPNTVARAYRELQGAGLLEPLRGTGLQVTGVAPERCGDERRAIVRQRLRAAIEEALRSDLAPAEIEGILREEWTRGNGAARGAAPGDARPAQAGDSEGGGRP